MTEEAGGPAVGELVSRHDSFHEIAELRDSLDGATCVVTTDDGYFVIKASDLSPAGAVKGVRIWK